MMKLRYALAAAAVASGENSLWSKSAQFTRFNMLRRS